MFMPVFSPTHAGGGALAISGSPVLTATEGEAYAGFTVTADGGTSPYVFSLVGTWPDGLSIDPDTGEVSGTPTESGSFASLSVRVTDDASDTDDLDGFTIEVEAEATDPNFASVVLLVGFDGSDGSTTFTDESGAAHALTAVGNVQVDTAQSKFGGASGLFDGAGDAITAADSAAWHFGTGDFTVEAWVRFSRVLPLQSCAGGF
jgi:hypothetical protein